MLAHFLGPRYQATSAHCRDCWGFV